MRKLLIMIAVLLVGLCFGDESQAAVVFRLAHNLGPQHPTHQAALRFKNLVESRTNKAIEVQVFSGLFGSDEEHVVALNTGVLDMALAVAGPYGTMQPEFQLSSLVYMFRDMPHAWKVFHSPLVQELSAKLLANKGIRIIAPFFYYGKRNLTANKPIRTPDDLKGLKIRVPNVRIQQEGIAAMGGQAAPLSFGEVYLALKQGLMDGQENPLSTIVSAKFYEVQKYVMLTEHIITNFMMGVSEKSFKKLNREQQIVFLEAAMEAEAYNNYLVRNGEETSLAKLQEFGMTVVIPEKDAFIKATESVRQKHAKKFSEVYRRIQEIR